MPQRWGKHTRVINPLLSRTTRHHPIYVCIHSERTFVGLLQIFETCVDCRIDYLLTYLLTDLHIFLTYLPPSKYPLPIRLRAATLLKPHLQPYPSFFPFFFSCHPPPPQNTTNAISLPSVSFVPRGKPRPAPLRRRLRQPDVRRLVRLRRRLQEPLHIGKAPFLIYLAPFLPHPPFPTQPSRPRFSPLADSAWFGGEEGGPGKEGVWRSARLVNLFSLFPLHFLTTCAHLVVVLQSFAKEDVLVAKIVRLRDSAQGALRRVSQVAAAATRPREPSRGRPRYRDVEYR